MLSLFRHATRRSLFAAHPAFVAHYSAESAESAESSHDVNMSGMQELQAVVRNFGDSESSIRPPEEPKWKQFKEGYNVQPHDFTYKARFNAPRTYQKRRARLGPKPSIARYNDPFYQLNIDPLDLATNPNVLSQFVSEMGKIMSRNVTGLTSKSQRRLGKAIRRAKMMGIIPILTRASS